jgi:hypothetical protein
MMIDIKHVGRGDGSARLATDNLFFNEIEDLDEKESISFQLAHKICAWFSCVNRRARVRGFRVLIVGENSNINGKVTLFTKRGFRILDIKDSLATLVKQ